MQPLALALSLAFSPRIAAATELDCAKARVEISGDLEESWREAVAQVCELLPGLPDIDPNARVAVVATAASIRDKLPQQASAPVMVLVALGDGRSASRIVEAPGALLATIEALVTMPPPAPASASPSRAREPRADAAPAAASTHLPEIAAPPKRPVMLSFDGGVEVVGRLRASPGYGTVLGTLYGGLNIDGWVVAANAQIAPADYLLSGASTYDDLETASFGGGIGVARRFSLASSVALDLGAAVDILAELQSVHNPAADQPSGQSMHHAPHHEITATSSDVRAAVAARAHFGRPGLHFITSFSLEVSPVRLGREVSAGDDFPDLPAFGASLGLGLGYGKW